MSDQKKREIFFSSSVAMAMDYAYQLIHGISDLKFLEDQEESDWMNSTNDMSKNPFVISKIVLGDIEDTSETEGMFCVEDSRERDIHFFISILGENHGVHVLTLTLKKELGFSEYGVMGDEYHENVGDWQVKIVKFGNFQDFYENEKVLNNLPNEIWI